MAHDWDIRARSTACRQCTTPFEDQQTYFSVLTYEDSEGYQRTDFCTECWPERENDPFNYSTWQGVFRMPPPKPEDPLARESAEGLLRRLMEGEDDSQRNAIYILALMLERKRTLIERDVQIRDDGGMIRVYEHRTTGETFLIPDPRLRLEQLEEVQEQVAALLGSEEAAQETKEDGGVPNESSPD